MKNLPQMTFAAKSARLFFGIIRILSIFAFIYCILYIPSVSDQPAMGVALVIGLCAAFVLSDFLFNKITPKDPVDDLWPKFPRDRPTEDTKRPWWRTALIIIGGLASFFIILIAMLLAMFYLLTTGPGDLLIAVYFGLPMAILWLISKLAIFSVIPKCRLCGNRMKVRTAPGRPINGITLWYVCFNCGIRAEASELEGGD